MHSIVISISRFGSPFTFLTAFAKLALKLLVVATNVTESVTDSVKPGRGGLAEILVLIGTAGGMLPPAECHRQPVLGSLLDPRGRISPNLSPIR